MTTRTGVLVMAYGTPASTADIPAFYRHILGGRVPPPALVADLERRYAAIGGLSPLAARTRAQVDGLQAELGDAYVAALGYKHAPPFIADAVGQLRAVGVTRAVGLVLAPHYSSLSVGRYEDDARTAAGPALELTMVRCWHLEDGLVDLLADRLRAARDRFPPEVRAEVATLVTAHSLPARILEAGDPYTDQVHETARAVTARAGVERWQVAWQSAGRSPEPWLGPDLRDVIRSLAAEGARGVLVCPAGFVSDHLEVLYDIDIDARAVAEEVGLQLERTASLNDDPRFLAVLADLVRRATPRS